LKRSTPDLFGGKPLAQVGVYYDSKTRDHTLFGNLRKGYYKDYAETLRAFFGAGISANTLFSFPEDAKEYAVVVVPSAVAMSEENALAMRRYIAAGGRVIVCGPSSLPECKNEWRLPTRPDIATPEDFFDTIAHGVWHKHAEWILNTDVEPTAEPCEWKCVGEGIDYNPHRMADGRIGEGMLTLVHRYAAKKPVEVLSAKGYLMTFFEKEDGTVLHALAGDYDTDIDHRLDEMRFHRSRVNYVNKVEPVGIDRTVTLRAAGEVQVYLPLSKEKAEVVREGDVCRITLPEKTAYAIVKILK
jgi:hypothetical protein